MHKHVIIWSFFTMLLIPAVFFFIPKIIDGNEENQVEYIFPSASNIINKDHVSNTNTYLSSTFIGRTQLLRLKTQTMLLSGQKETNGVYITDSRLVESPNLPSDETTQKITDLIKDFSSVQTVPVYVMMIPTSSEVYKDSLPIYIPTVDEVSYINKTYEQLTSGQDEKQLDDKLITLDAVSPLTSSKSENIFYKTDRRITSLGAYRIYTYNSKFMGLTSTTLMDYSIEHASFTFKGNLYNKIQLDVVEPDMINLYHYTKEKLDVEVNVKSGSENIENDSIYFRDKLATSDEASVYLGDVKPLIDIEISNDEDNSILIFGDENAGVITQFLLPHYDRITIVNLNYLTKYYAKDVDVDQYDSILFISSLSSWQDGTRFRNLQLLQSK